MKEEVDLAADPMFAECIEQARKRYYPKGKASMSALVKYSMEVLPQSVEGNCKELFLRMLACILIGNHPIPHINHLTEFVEAVNNHPMEGQKRDLVACVYKAIGDVLLDNVIQLTMNCLKDFGAVLGVPLQVGFYEDGDKIEEEKPPIIH